MSNKNAFGFLNIDKPAGMTSRRAVDIVHRLVRPARAGHAGTLDPLATGVLVIGVGRATRLIEYVQQQPKTYRGEFLLGRRSDTEDIEGQVVELDDPPVPELSDLIEAAAGLTGEILQRPPQYSALKVAGRRAYDLARRGEKVDLKPRPIRIYRLDIAEYNYPRLVLDVKCGSGTYIRSLGRDLAEQLGTAAVMSRLVRTAIGRFELANAISPETLDTESVFRYLEPALSAVPMLRRIDVTADQLPEIRQGRSIADPAGAELNTSSTEETQPLAGVGPDGQLVALLVQREPGRLGPVRVFI